MNMFNMALGTGLKGPKTLQNEALATSPEKNTAPVAAMHLPCAKPRIFERRFSFLAAPTPPWLPVENGSCHQHEFCFLYGVAPFPPWFMVFMVKKIHFTLPQNPTEKTFRKALEKNPWPRLLTAPKGYFVFLLSVELWFSSFCWMCFKSYDGFCKSNTLEHTITYLSKLLLIPQIENIGFVDPLLFFWEGGAGKLGGP